MQIVLTAIFPDASKSHQSVLWTSKDKTQLQLQFKYTTYSGSVEQIPEGHAKINKGAT